jgi:hypothetical protein
LITTIGHYCGTTTNAAAAVAATIIIIILVLKRRQQSWQQTSQPVGSVTRLGVDEFGLL